jgi:hypothetical protein
MAIYLTAVSAGGLLLAVMLFSELLTIPSAGFVKAMVFGR